MAPRTNQELLDCLVTAPLLMGDLSQGTSLDRPLPERPPLVLAQLPENGAHDVSVYRLCLRIGIAYCIGLEIRPRAVPMLPTLQHIEAITAGHC